MCEDVRATLPKSLGLRNYPAGQSGRIFPRTIWMSPRKAILERMKPATSNCSRGYRYDLLAARYQRAAGQSLSVRDR